MNEKGEKQTGTQTHTDWQTQRHTDTKRQIKKKKTDTIQIREIRVMNLKQAA